MSKFYDHKIKYRRLDQLIDTVSDEWSNFEAEGFIEPSHLIKVITKINKQLGLRITKTKEQLVDVDNWVANLPQDMENLNFAILCGEVTFSVPAIQGIQTENVFTDCTHGCNQVYITPHGETYVIVQRIAPDIDYTYHIVRRVKLKHSLYQVDNSDVMGVFIKDHFLKMNIRDGRLYLNYEGIMEDEDGTLLVVDHPLLNDYYEYALKRKVLENMYFRGDADVERRLQLVEARYREAKKEALTVANMPEFKEIQETFEINRKAMYKRYYSIFI